LPHREVALIEVVLGDVPDPLPRPAAEVGREAGGPARSPEASLPTAPRLSVVIPAYNEVALLPDCLRSLAAQDFRGSVEVIVVDNNSTDETAALARTMGATVVSEPHPGVCWARQCGTLAAHGEIVVSTDADTTFGRGWLSRIDAAFRDQPSRVAITGPCQFAEAPWWGRVYGVLLFGFVAWFHRLTGRVVYASATNIAFRRDSWPGYDTRATQGGDELDLLRRLRVRGRVDFDAGNPTSTSSRRLYRGLLYNLVVTCAFYYLTGYLVNRVCGRTVIGTAPHIRQAGPRPAPAPRWAHHLRGGRCALAPWLIRVVLVASLVTTYLLLT
jgi:glycosyltransferase involved in cell wall biosynthesis